VKKIVNPLTPGDVIQTHPARGYWGCAVVLSARDSTDKFQPMCHIGITTLITRKKYSWKSISPAELEIAKLAYDVRVAPHEYYRAPDIRTCIGIYSVKSSAGLSIIGRVDPIAIYSPPLTFDVGDGTNGRFPMCGPVPADLGDEAVTAWRRVHDSAKLERDVAKDRELFERVDEKIRSDARKARKARSTSAAPNNSFKPKPLRGSA